MNHRALKSQTMSPPLAVDFELLLLQLLLLDDDGGHGSCSRVHLWQQLQPQFFSTCTLRWYDCRVSVVVVVAAVVVVVELLELKC